MYQLFFLLPQYAPSASYSSGANYGGGGGSGGGFSAFGAGGGRGSGYPYAKSWGPQREVTVIKKDSEGLGISIVGGKVEMTSSTVAGIFIKNVIPSSPAGRSVCQYRKSVRHYGNSVRQYRNSVRAAVYKVRVPL